MSAPSYEIAHAGFIPGAARGPAPEPLEGSSAQEWDFALNPDSAYADFVPKADDDQVVPQGPLGPCTLLWVQSEIDRLGEEMLDTLELFDDDYALSAQIYKESLRDMEGSMAYLRGRPLETEAQQLDTMSEFVRVWEEHTRAVARTARSFQGNYEDFFNRIDATIEEVKKLQAQIKKVTATDSTKQDHQRAKGASQKGKIRRARSYKRAQRVSSK